MLRWCYGIDSRLVLSPQRAEELQKRLLAFDPFLFDYHPVLPTGPSKAKSMMYSLLDIAHMIP